MKKQKKLVGFQFRNDLILIISLLVISAIGIFYLFVLRESGDMVKVMVDGEVFGTYNLSENVSKEIRTGKNGEKLNRFVINGGKVYMEEASCPDGICVAHRPAFRDGESIVCLPNRVVLTIETKDDKDAPDIVA